MTKQYELRSFPQGMSGIGHQYYEERHSRQESLVTQDEDAEIREAIITFHNQMILERFSRLGLTIETKIHRDNQ